MALDPGVRTFLTYFSETDCGKIGHHAFGRIQRLCHWLDDLISRTAKAPNRRKRRQMRSAQARMRQRITNLVDELHWQLARWLTSNYRIILLPTFETHDMTQRAGRRIRSKTARMMLTFRHFEFKQRLQWKAWQRGALVLDVNGFWSVADDDGQALIDEVDEDDVPWIPGTPYRADCAVGQLRPAGMRPCSGEAPAHRTRHRFNDLEPLCIQHTYPTLAECETRAEDLMEQAAAARGRALSAEREWDREQNLAASSWLGQRASRYRLSRGLGMTADRVQAIELGPPVGWLGPDFLVDTPATGATLVTLAAD